MKEKLKEVRPLRERVTGKAKRVFIGTKRDFQKNL